MVIGFECCGNSQGAAPAPGLEWLPEQFGPDGHGLCSRLRADGRIAPARTPYTGMHQRSTNRVCFWGPTPPPTPPPMDPSPTPDFAQREFKCKAEFIAALAKFQEGKLEPTIAAEARRAASHGFAWFAKPLEPGCFEVRLCHSGGATVSAQGPLITALLAGLLGHPLAQGVAAAEHAAAPTAASPAEEEAGTPTPSTHWSSAPTHGNPPWLLSATWLTESTATEPSTAPVQAAAESLAAATGGAVVAEQAADHGPDSATPLTGQQKAVAIGMISKLSVEQRKAFTIAFRDAFRVPREAKAIAPLITEVRHMEFCDRWSIEAGGGVAP